MRSDLRTALQNIQKCRFLCRLKDLQYKMLSQKKRSTKRVPWFCLFFFVFFYKCTRTNLLSESEALLLLSRLRGSVSIAQGQKGHDLSPYFRHDRVSWHFTRPFRSSLCVPHSPKAKTSESTLQLLKHKKEVKERDQ